MSSWDDAASWYGNAVGEKGHYYHESLLIPNALRLLNLQKGESLLDLGCGQGVFARALPKNVSYLGVDLSRKLIQEAKKRSPALHFIAADLCKPLALEKRDFDAAIFLLSLQNMQDPEAAILHAASHLRPGGQILFVLNHPCFRIPRQSSWGIDEQAKLQYRKINRYMSAMKIPIQTHPSQQEKGPLTFSWHHSLSDLSRFMTNAGFAINTIEEWCSDKKSTGAKAKMENLAREEFPLFLAISASLFKKE